MEYGVPRVRPAVPADRAAAELLLRAHTLPVAGVAEYFTDFLVAELQGEMVGLIGVERYAAPGCCARL